MKIFLTGASGFVGKSLARELRAKGHDVLALCRSDASASTLASIGCEILHGDLTDGVGFNLGMSDADAVIHAAAAYKIGIPFQECIDMHDVNAGGTRRIMDAAIETGVKKIVYVSTINIYGDTRGSIVDETHKRMSIGFASCYEESKTQAQQIVNSRVEQGAPIVSVMPGAVYGPGDHSIVGKQILQAAQGDLKAMVLADVGLTMVYVDDVAKGIVAALENGEPGESYILGGENTTLRELLTKSAEIAHMPLPKREISVKWLKRLIPASKILMPLFGLPTNLSEMIHVCDGATYWVKSDKAAEKLGYTYRSLDEGLAQTLKNENLLVRA